MKDAEVRGCKIVQGLSMFVYQGAEAFEIWTNTKAPVDIMFEVVKEGYEVF